MAILAGPPANLHSSGIHRNHQNPAGISGASLRPHDLAQAAKILEKACFTSKAQFEQRFIKQLSRDEYKPEELVLVRNTGIELSHNGKHQAWYLGPYKVNQKASEKSYTL